DRRYRDAAALLADLEKLHSGRPVRRFARWHVVAAIAALVATVGIFSWNWARRFATESHAAPASVLTSVTRESVAVLPFVNLSGDPAQEYFADGLSDGVLNA